MTDLRPCEGKNTSVCVAEGCFNQECVKPAMGHPDVRRFLPRFDTGSYKERLCGRGAVFIGSTGIEIWIGRRWLAISW